MSIEHLTTLDYEQISSLEPTVVRRWARQAVAEIARLQCEVDRIPFLEAKIERRQAIILKAANLLETNGEISRRYSDEAYHLLMDEVVSSGMTGRKEGE